MVRRTKERVTGALEALVAICWKWAKVLWHEWELRHTCYGPGGVQSRPPCPCGPRPRLLSPNSSPDSLLRVSYSGGRHRSQAPSSTRSPQTLWTLCRYGRMPEVTSFGVADLGTIVAASITPRREKMAPHRDSSPPSLTTTEGCLYRFQETRLSLLFHARHNKFTCKSQVPWLPAPFQARATAPSPAMLRAPLCFQNRSPPLTPSGPAQRPASFTKPRCLPSPSLLVLTLALTLPPVILKRDCGATQPAPLIFSIAVT